MEDYSSVLRIKEILQQKGVKPIELSAKTSIEKGNLSAIINGKRNPTLRTLMSIADALGVSLTELFAEPKEHSAFKATFVCPNCGEEYDIEIKRHGKPAETNVTENIG